MAGDQLDIFPAGTLAKGIDTNAPDFQTDVQWTPATVNATSGIVEGVGPRYGTAPLPGHSDSEAVAAGKLPGMMRAETAMSRAGTNTVTRQKLFAIHPLTLRGDGSVNPLTKTFTFYAAVVGYSYSGQTYADVLLLSTAPAAFMTRSANLTDGLPAAGVDNPIVVNFAELRYQYAGAAGVGPLTQIDAATNFVCSTPFSVSGIEVPMQWIFGKCKDQGSANRAPSINLGPVTISNLSTLVFNGGIPPAFQYGNFPTTTRAVSVYGMTSGGHFNLDYTIQQMAPSTTIYQPIPSDGDTASTQVNLTGVAANKISSLTNYAANATVLYNDPLLTCNSAYQGILVATGDSAFAAVFQDWYKGYSGDSTQYVDLTQDQAPPSWTGASSTSGYVENGAVTPSCFAWWPTFVRGTAMVAQTPSEGVALGAANTGLLRANTVYELAFSLRDKRLNYETNVGAPVKIQTGVNDFVSVILFTGDATYGSYSEFVTKNQLGSVPFPSGSCPSINYLEYRFYYRQEGMQEWLPALFVDAAKLWFYTHWSPLALCTGGIGGTVGGRPGGFNDYSPLPKDKWDCVVMYKNRAFWFSSKSLNFSLQGNLMAYPGVNSAACPAGSFKGGLVRAYYGQAAQDAQLVVFTTMGTLVGKFTGNQQQVPVQVSASSVGTFGLDGSDFILNPWTSVTAFSYRSAVVAEGILYFWGPQGIFMDDGVNPISRISIPLEPDIFGYYDPAQTDAIFCTYNDATKEIIWFYAPKTADATFPTYGLVWNTYKKTWLPTKFRGQVDSAQTLRIDSAALPVAGTRTVAYARQNAAATIQRGFFFDQNDQAGDVFPGSELMVKQVSTPMAGKRRLTMAAGSASLAGIVAGDVVALSESARYSNGALATPSDFMATVDAVNAGAGTLDLVLPAGAELDGAVAIGSNAQFFPVWHAGGAAGKINANGMHGIPYVIDGKFWIPRGMAYWAYWLYVHLVFKLYSLLPGDAPTVELSYTSPIARGVTQTDVLTLTDNAGGNCQIFHSLIPNESATEGQGIKFTFSGIQLAGAYVLQFLEAYAQQKDGMQLKDFEG